MGQGLGIDRIRAAADTRRANGFDVVPISFAIGRGGIGKAGPLHLIVEHDRAERIERAHSIAMQGASPNSIVIGAV